MNHDLGRRSMTRLRLAGEVFPSPLRHIAASSRRCNLSPAKSGFPYLLVQTHTHEREGAAEKEMFTGRRMSSRVPCEEVS